MTDRERLEVMARENAERQAKEAAEAQRKEAERKQALAELAATEKRKTDELRVYCEETFGGFKLVPTGHEVSVGTTTTSRMHRIENDGEYVTLLISHWGHETGDFQGSFPILMARYKGGKYEYIAGVESKRTHADNWDDFKEVLMKSVAGTGRTELRSIFAAVKRMIGR